MPWMLKIALTKNRGAHGNIRNQTRNNRPLTSSLYRLSSRLLLQILYWATLNTNNLKAAVEYMLWRVCDVLELLKTGFILQCRICMEQHLQNKIWMRQKHTETRLHFSNLFKVSSRLEASCWTSFIQMVHCPFTVYFNSEMCPQPRSMKNETAWNAQHVVPTWSRMA